MSTVIQTGLEPVLGLGGGLNGAFRGVAREVGKRVQAMSTPPRHEVLQDRPGANVCLLGNLAIVRGALEAGVQFFSCYPGTPSSEVGDTFYRIAHEAGVIFEYSVNEKIAVEIAFAASLAGARSMCGMKHLGLNYAADPISTMPYVGVNGGMVIVSAGDPSAITSPNEQDQRQFTSFLYYPIFDPATPDDAFRMTRYAFEFSEKTRLPVILRPTTRVCHSSGMVKLGTLPTERNQIQFTKDPQRYVPIPANARRMRKELTERYAQAEWLLADSEFFPRVGTGRRGIIAGGVAYAYVAQVIRDLELENEVCLQQIGAYPIPEKVLRDFLEVADSVLVVEELTPFIEDWVTRAAYRSRKNIEIIGKNTGHFPIEFEYSPDLVEDAIRAYLGLAEREVVSVSVPDLPPRPPVLCPGCPHRASFYSIRKVFGKKTVYCNDIGCYTLGYGEPLQACDMLLCMGSSITQACGIARVTGQRTVAYIGDSTFFHSGLPALANAVQANDDVTVVILDNFITAMTGFQPSLTTGTEAKSAETAADSSTIPAKAPPFSIENAVRGLGVQEVYSVDPFDGEATATALKKAKGGSGINVVVCHAPCAVEARRAAKSAQPPVLAIDPERCNACSACVRMLGCPALFVGEEFNRIDSELCNGCGLCIDVCQQGAIQMVGAEKV
ncbi:MAG: indolepyruvate ferredoxin oxidoreductase subunit alpha [Planctomycetes bacterium]|nr:indolepyruvate ferredoxin oxidoreductase subunit alpha [Planctomycetota bacterium]